MKNGINENKQCVQTAVSGCTGILTTDLQINIWVLETYSKNYKKVEYIIYYYPSRLIYLPEIDKCNKFINKYAYKQKVVSNFEAVFEDIKTVLIDASKFDNRIDILFNRTDRAHRSKEYLNESNGLFILYKEHAAFNRELNQDEIKSLKSSLVSYYNDLWIS